MIDQKVIDLYDKYAHAEISRRQFLEKLAILAGGVAAAYATLPFLENNYAEAQIVPADDSRLVTTTITYPGSSADINAYLARPKDVEKMPAVLVVHENKGLNPHIEDVTRRIALEGYLALAPDALSAVGGSPADPTEAATRIKELDMQQTLNNFVAAAAYLKTHPQSTGKVGVVGFCWGGAMANQLAVHSEDIIAAVPYYGKQPADEDVAKIKASLLLHYAGMDERINQGIAAYKIALDKNGIDYTLFMYDGANHAFNNDTNAARYNKESAELAWKRTLLFFNGRLKS
jgi:carboxymethylenebutenolidase